MILMILEGAHASAAASCHRWATLRSAARAGRRYERLPSRAVCNLNSLLLTHPFLPDGPEPLIISARCSGRIACCFLARTAHADQVAQHLGLSLAELRTVASQAD